MNTTSEQVHVRPATPSDEPDVLRLLTASLGWVPDDQHGAFFRWKHEENPFGRSPAWVALDHDGIAGFRTFLRWEWVRGDGRVARAVRAVDTATHPRAQGRGIFSTLTRHAVEHMTADGVDFVFNTPNDQSRPGYLKMGWREVGRLPVDARPASLPGLIRMARARVAAEKWSQPGNAGEPAREVLANTTLVSSLLDSQPPTAQLRTNRSPAFFAWRYGFEPLHYRVMPATDALEDGFAVFRLRRRGPALEATIADVLVNGGDARLESRAVANVVRRSRCDYGIRLRGPGPRAGFVPVPGQGPTLTWRALGDTEMPAAWDLVLGDVELF